MSDTDHLLNIVKFYRQQGFRIALDDLGAGYGSLNLLTSLKPDFVKFDRELIRGVDLNPYKQKVFVKLVEMAGDLGIHRPASPPPSSTPLLSEQTIPLTLPVAERSAVPLSLELALDSDALQGVLDSLHEQVAVIDASGKILTVNHAWQQAGLAGGLPQGTRFTGVNYLDICRAASHEGLEDAVSSYEGIRNVLDGVSSSFSFEYLCDTPQGERWFLMNATPFSRKLGGAVILHMDITGRKLQEAKIHLLAHHDELTGAANRRYFYEEAQRTLLQAERDMLPFSLLYLDLDDFKGVNDRYGHACGDELLKHVSARLQGLLRDGDLLARFGGDEFVLLLKGVTGGDAESVAGRYRAALEEPFVSDGQQLRSVGSLGTVSYPEQGRTIDELLRHADAAMYREKAGRRRTKQLPVDELREERLLT